MIFYKFKLIALLIIVCTDLDYAYMIFNLQVHGYEDFEKLIKRYRHVFSFYIL